jgi:hypothetical protein
VEWTDERARVVLCHELAHIRRGDWIIQMIAELLRCAYWFNPLLWIVCRRLRLESEHACDDAVLARGVKGSDYAEQLLNLARVLNESRQPWFPAPAMARPSSLERRVSAMLNANVNRRPITRAARVIAVIALAAVTLPIAAIAQATFSTFSGSVFDPQDAVLPATKVVLTNSQTKAKYEVTSDRDGRFQFVGLPPGQYIVEAMLPGFATARATLTVAGQDVQQDFRLPVAGLEETVTVVEGDFSRPSEVVVALRRPLPSCFGSPAPATPGIGGQIRPPKRIRAISPIYPGNVPGARAEEIVTLEARIRPDGTMGDVVATGTPNPVFANAALEAVRQWEFDETLLNCVPIDVSMKVTVKFRAAAQAKAGVRFNLTVPSVGAKPQLMVEDGGLGTVAIPDLGSFGIRATIRDRETGLVTFTLQEGREENGRVIAEVSTRLGDPPVALGTKPAFSVSVVSIR